MKKILILLALLLSMALGNNYTEGYKYYMQGKIAFNNDNSTKANVLFAKALHKFYLAAKNNNSQAILKLATMYCNGWGVKQNETTAKLYLNKVKKLIPNIHIYNECLKNLETKEHK